MRNLHIIVVLLAIVKTHAQQNITGHYHDYFGSKIEFKADSTFKYKWHVDLSVRWAEGRWVFKNDTIYLKVIPVYDTLRYRDTGSLTTTDSLVLSVDEEAEAITPEQYASAQLSSGRQNRSSLPEKLYYRNGKLFRIDRKGKIVRKKEHGFWSKKKYPSNYVREKE